MSRLTDHDYNFGPLTWGRANWNPLRLVWESGDDEEGEHRNALTAYAFGCVARLWLPNILRPYRVKHMAPSWDADTVARLGRDWYYETHPREYGFSICNGALQLFFGRQTHDSSTTQDWYWEFPWMHWSYIRLSYYGLEGELLWTEYEDERARGQDRFSEQQAAKEAAPKRVFEIIDFDKEIIEATTLIEEREWHLGRGWFSWLSWFAAPRIRRSLDIQFNHEVGPQKGSWKGGMLGHGIDILPGELHEAAFRRYCEQDHTSKHTIYRIAYVRELS